jgi:hypothetical protein
LIHPSLSILRRSHSVHPPFPCSSPLLFLDRQTYKGGNDHEIFMDSRTIGHTVTCPEDTIALLDELFLQGK